MLSTSVEASACSASPASKAVRACCAGRPSGDCGCCGEKTSVPSPKRVPGEATFSLSAVATISETSTPSCECRESEPAAPSNKSSQRLSETRSDDGRTDAVSVLIAAVRPPATSRHLFELNASPPKIPLYLHTSHLLL
jgi:hypothetical protein